MIAAQHLDVHFQALLEQAQRVLVIARLHVALSEQRQDLRMVTLRLLVLLEKGAVELQSSCQVVQGLLVVLVIEIRLAELRVRLHEDEEFLAVDVNQYLANRQLFNSYLYLSIKVLAHEKLVQLLVLLNQVTAYPQVHLLVVHLAAASARTAYLAIHAGRTAHVFILSVDGAVHDARVLVRQVIHVHLFLVVSTVVHAVGVHLVKSVLVLRRILIALIILDIGHFLEPVHCISLPLEHVNAVWRIKLILRHCFLYFLN